MILNTKKLEENAKKIDLNINETKTKVVKIFSNKDENLSINGKALEKVETSMYLGANISTEGGTDKDLTARIKKAEYTFKTLYNIWGSVNINLKLKIQLFNTTVRSVLL